MPESGFHITSVLSIIVAVLSLAVSSLTAWLTLLRKGHILMTQPTVIYFGPDGGFHATAVVEPVPRLARKEPASNNQTITIERRTAPIKVYLRTLLYSTGKKGHVIENMFVRLHRGETQQNFNIWTYGDKDLYRGSGLFVPETGVASNHHFLLPPDGTNFQFSSGRYTLDIFATEVGVHNSQLLFKIELEISPELAEHLESPDHGIYFDWGPDSQRYFPHVEKSTPVELKAANLYLGYNAPNRFDLTRRDSDPQTDSDPQGSAV